MSTMRNHNETDAADIQYVVVSNDKDFGQVILDCGSKRNVAVAAPAPVTTELRKISETVITLKSNKDVPVLFQLVAGGPVTKGRGGQEARTQGVVTRGARGGGRPHGRSNKWVLPRPDAGVRKVQGAAAQKKKGKKRGRQDAAGVVALDDSDDESPGEQGRRRRTAADAAAAAAEERRTTTGAAAVRPYHCSRAPTLTAFTWRDPVGSWLVAGASAPGGARREAPSSLGRGPIWRRRLAPANQLDRFRHH